MKKLLGFIVGLMTVLAAVPFVMAETPTVGTGLGIDMQTENFVPRVFMYPERFITHNNADGGKVLVERVENYAFEGEQIHWLVLVWDKNGDDKISDVYVTIGSGQGTGNDIEANCNQLQIPPHWDGNSQGLNDLEELRDFFKDADPESGPSYRNFNVKELEEDVEWNPNTMNIYLCTLTVETPDSMYGEYFVTVEAEDVDGNLGTFDENEYWFLNPVIALEVVGSLDFGTVRPGSNSYSDTLLIRNDADAGSGVLLNMFISGTDFYDPDSSGAKCPTSNILSLQNLAYYATNGNYHTLQGYTARENTIGGSEGYYGIPYETGDEDDRAPIIEGQGSIPGTTYPLGNVLAPGAEIAMTFRLALPEPCNGDFSDGQIYFWGEAI